MPDPVGLRDGQGVLERDRGVDRVPALPKDARRDAARDRIDRRDHPVCGGHLLAARELRVITAEAGDVRDLLVLRVSGRRVRSDRECAGRRPGESEEPTAIDPPPAPIETTSSSFVSRIFSSRHRYELRTETEQ